MQLTRTEFAQTLRLEEENKIVVDIREKYNMGYTNEEIAAIAQKHQSKKRDMTIKCKPVLVSKLTIWMTIIGGAIVLALFLTLSGRWDYLSIYTLSIAILTPMLIYIFYLNRFELLFVGVENENVHLSFVNNSIYKRKDIKTTKNNITVEQKGDKLLFSMDNKLQAILRKAAVGEPDWDRVLQMFTKS